MAWACLGGLLLSRGGMGAAVAATRHRADAAIPAAAGAATRSTAVAEETRRIDGPLPGLKLGLTHAFIPGGHASLQSPPVLILPGAAVPVSGNPAYHFVPGRSLMTALAQTGLDVWALDYYGFGISDRYPEMDQPATSHPPLGNSQEVVEQVSAVVEFLQRERHAREILLIGDSGGTLPAGLFATLHPDLVSRLILFGPVTPFTDGPDAGSLPAYDLITPQDLWSLFTSWSQAAGSPAVLDPTAAAAWSEEYLRSDPTSRTRSPPSVRVPNGRQADLAAITSGRFTYDPGAIKAPTLIVMGEWDAIATFAGAEWLLHSLRHAPSRKLVVLGRGSHTIQYESEREQLYRELAAFLLPATVPDGVRTSANAPAPEGAPRRAIRIVGFGALTGPVKSFGTNSRAALMAAADDINRNGGIALADGARGYFDVSYEDAHCNAADGIEIVRRTAASDALALIGPTCSAVAEAVYSSLQHKLDDASDPGPQIPIFTDTAMKAHLAQISEWAFRNSPDETEMYTTLWEWVRQQHPDLKTLYGGEEGDFAHSHSTWSNIMKPTAVAAGLNVIGSTSWSLTDTVFTSQVAQMKVAKADIIVVSGHPETTCGVLREVARQKVTVRLIVGLTSAASAETLLKCGPEAEGLLIPTSFAARDSASRAAAKAVESAGGIADLHSMAAWENLHTLARVIQRAGVLGTPASVSADRRKLRQGLVDLQKMDGLLGSINRTPDRESHKPFVLVRATHGEWQVAYTPAR